MSKRYVHYRDGKEHLIVDTARGRSVSVANGRGETSFYMHPATLDGKLCEISSKDILYLPKMRRRRVMKRPDKWDRKGKFLADEFHGRRMLPKKYVAFVAETITRALRRTDAAAENRIMKKYGLFPESEKERHAS